ncbi:MAG: chemotaxis protein CheW [Spirochaetia bacterium]|nr:chemotaxis protein CheW [Spirochaetia bacterium]
MQTTEKTENRLEKMIGIVAEKLGKKVPDIKINKNFNAYVETEKETDISFNNDPNANLVKKVQEDILDPEAEDQFVISPENNQEAEQTESLIEEEKTNKTSEPIVVISENSSSNQVKSDKLFEETDEDDDNFEVSSEDYTSSSKLDSFFLSDLGGMGSQIEEDEEIDESVFIGFFLNSDPYAINVLQVKEITTIPEISKMPNAPDFLEGVIELRKNLIPVIDLKKRFHMGKSNLGSEAKVLIIDAKDKEIGLIVESVTEVLRVDSQIVEKAPGMVSGVEKQYISGIVNQSGKMTVILNLEKILSSEELAKLARLEENKEKNENIEKPAYSKNAPPLKGGALINA